MNYYVIATQCDGLENEHVDIHEADYPGEAQRLARVRHTSIYDGDLGEIASHILYQSGVRAHAETYLEGFRKGRIDRELFDHTN